MESVAISQTTPSSPTLSSRELADLFVQLAADKKAENIQLYNLSEQGAYTDYVLVCSGTSDRHVSTIAEHIREKGKKHGELPLGVEGMSGSQWVLLDYSNVVVHVFYEPVREYYALERMWDKELRVELPPDVNI